MAAAAQQGAEEAQQRREAARTPGLCVNTATADFFYLDAPESRLNSPESPPHFLACPHSSPPTRSNSPLCPAPVTPQQHPFTPPPPPPEPPTTHPPNRSQSPNQRGRSRSPPRLGESSTAGRTRSPPNNRRESPQGRCRSRSPQRPTTMPPLDTPSPGEMLDLAWAHFKRQQTPTAHVRSIYTPPIHNTAAQTGAGVCQRVRTAPRTIVHTSAVPVLPSTAARMPEARQQDRSRAPAPDATDCLQAAPSKLAVAAVTLQPELLPKTAVAHFKSWHPVHGGAGALLFSRGRGAPKGTPRDGEAVGGVLLFDAGERVRPCDEPAHGATLPPAANIAQWWL